LHEVGALLEARSVHTGRSAYNHLLALAQTHGIPRSRVEELIEIVGLQSVAKKRAGQFSLGMGQRLGIAAALLGDPEVVILDEPVNGLDPDGIRWIRDLMKKLAAEGRTVFLSSHDLAEIESFASHVGYLEEGTLRFSEEMTVLAGRFREVEITLEADRGLLPAGLPGNWLQVKAAGGVVQLVESQFEEERTSEQIRGAFGEVKEVAFRAMGLRAIFLAMARKGEDAQGAG